MITKDKKDVSISEINSKNYLVPKGEEKLYHIKMEVKQFDANSGKRLSHPFIQKFNAIDVENGMMSLLRQQGYDMEILHDPKEASRKAAEKAAEKEAEKAAKEKAEKAAKEEAEKAAKEAEKAAKEAEGKK